MPPPASIPRTNSLAFAKTDCHTCTANQRRCDRKRPRCSSCSGRNIVCGSYPMQLTWPKSNPIQPKAAMFLQPTEDPFYLEPLSLQASIQVRDRNSRSRPHKPRKFKFVVEKTPGRKHISTESCEAHIGQSSAYHGEPQPWTSTQKSNTALDRPIHQIALGSPLSGTLDDDIQTSSPNLSNKQSNVYDPLAMLFPFDFSSDPFDWWSWSPTGTVDIENPGILEDLDKDYNTVATPSGNAAVEHHSPILMFTDPRQNLIALGSPILHKSLFEKFETLLNMYDEDFCVVPLSGDIPSNPFRSRPGTSQGSQSLLHAILAVSCYHAGRQASKGEYPPLDVIDHQNTALKLYHDELDTCTGSQGVQLLDTTMVLFLYNATQSAFSNWTTRLSEARKLLRLSGGPDIWVENRKIQAQVMLLWWDATIALLSRQGCILPYSYFESLLALEDDRYWSFFDLVGCPRELVIPLMQLTSLAEENEKASSMRWTSFDLTFVNEVQASIINWRNPSLEIDDNVSEEQMQQQRDRWNCTEAWRYGLLIYITRVFRWKRNMSPPSRLALYARLILEHVNSCRQSTIVQKQAFLPLFFAGCETKDQFSRQNIRDYCRYWDKNSGYNLFNCAASLLEDVWAEQDESPSDGAWWGSVIDKKQQPHHSQVVPMQFCFG